MFDVELAKLVQYIINEVRLPAVNYSSPLITILPPYHRTIRIPIYGKNSLHEVYIPESKIFFLLIE